MNISSQDFHKIIKTRNVITKFRTVFFILFAFLLIFYYILNLKNANDTKADPYRLNLAEIQLSETGEKDEKIKVTKKSITK